MKSCRLAVLMGLLFFVRATATHAADITIVHRDPAGALVGIEGDLELADGEKFANLIRPLNNAVVLFNSRGGSLLAGLRIGELIQSRGFATLVPDDDVCASACALAWLGGAKRYLAAKSHLGFHAAYTGDGSNSQVSGSGNALVGAYLERLNLSDEAIFALTDTEPTDIRWLDVTAANSLGIATEEFRIEDAAPQATIARTPSSPQQRAVTLVNAYFNAGSSDATTAIAWVASHYADSINFYGTPTPLVAVLKQKRAYVIRWPERLYIPVERTLRSACSADGSACRVTGTVQFECRSYTRGAHSAGLASFTINVDLTGRNPLVSEEGGAVLVRR